MCAAMASQITNAHLENRGILLAKGRIPSRVRTCASSGLPLRTPQPNYFCVGLMATGLPVVPGSCFGFSVAMSLICLVIATDWNVSALESCFKSC